MVCTSCGAGANVCLTATTVTSCLTGYYVTDKKICA